MTGSLKGSMEATSLSDTAAHVGRPSPTRDPADDGAVARGFRGLAGPRAEKSVSLALQGGGSHGAFTWGVLDALIEDGRLAFEAVTGGRIPYRVVERRPGDIAESCAAVDAIGAEVGWYARRDVTAMVRDLWAWQEANPAGFSPRTE